MSRAFDPHCGVLATYFLGGMAPERLTNGLAMAIQEAVEEWLQTEKVRIEAELESESGVQ